MEEGGGSGGVERVARRRKPTRGSESAGEAKSTYRQPFADVAGVKPAVRVQRLGRPLRVFEVALEHVGALHTNLGTEIRVKYRYIIFRFGDTTVHMFGVT